MLFFLKCEAHSQRCLRNNRFFFEQESRAAERFPPPHPLARLCASSVSRPRRAEHIASTAPLASAVLFFDRCQTYQTTHAECQTESSILTQTEAASGDENLASFLAAVMPAVEEALRENAASESFRGEDHSLMDDGVATVECVHRLTPYPPDGPAGGAADFWAGLQPTGVSWSASGYQLAVSYGRFDVSGWCDSPGALCVWNLRREDINPCKPDQVMEVDNCLQCVAFHPTHPALVVAGSYNGELYVWDLSAGEDEDALRARSKVSDASHREPITQVSWLFNIAEASKTSNRAAAYNVVSLGSDGRVLVWNWLKMDFPAYGYELKARLILTLTADRSTYPVVDACVVESNEAFLRFNRTPAARPPENENAAPNRKKRPGESSLACAFLIVSSPLVARERVPTTRRRIQRRRSFSFGGRPAPPLARGFTRARLARGAQMAPGAEEPGPGTRRVHSWRDPTAVRCSAA